MTSPHINQKSVCCASHTYENRSSCQPFGVLKHFCEVRYDAETRFWSLKNKSSVASWACSREGVSAGGSHALQQWQTVINTQTECCELHTAVGINSISLPVNPSLVSSCCYIPGEGCNQTIKSREPDRKWMETDGPNLECVSDPIGEGPRLAGGMLWLPFCSQLQSFVVKSSFLKSVFMPLSEKWQVFYSLADEKQEGSPSKMHINEESRGFSITS